MTELFCTPEQGVKLKELLPELTSYFMWVNGNGTPKIKWISQKDLLPPQGDEYTYTPALTLQELRDVAKEHLTASIILKESITKRFEIGLFTETAPDLADWVIERLEEGR